MPPCSRLFNILHHRPSTTPQVDRVVTRQKLSWTSLPADLQAEMTSIVELWRQAADLGSADAQYNVAMSHHEGKGVAPNAVKTMRW